MVLNLLTMGSTNKLKLLKDLVDPKLTKEKVINDNYEPLWSSVSLLIVSQKMLSPRIFDILNMIEYVDY